MARDTPSKPRRRLLPFRLPIFRIFYSITYTALYILCLLILAITPISMLWSAIQHEAFQYVFMLGGAYVLTALCALFIYSSRLYTNRTTLASVGKAYVPVEPGEVGANVRRMIVKQLERSAVVAWEGRPRDLHGEILEAAEEGTIPRDARGLAHHDYTVGTLIRVDPDRPPWGLVQHAGWSSPSRADENRFPNVRYADVVEELPHLIEARAVSLAPPPDHLTQKDGELLPTADPAVVALLQRPANMTLREYLAQLASLGLIQPPAVGQRFLAQYERARFSSRPASTPAFNALMTTFADLLAGMTELRPAILDALYAQTADREHVSPARRTPPDETDKREDTPSPSRASHLLTSPVTARERLSRAVTPYSHPAWASEESLASVIRNPPSDREDLPGAEHGRSPGRGSLRSRVGSVLRSGGEG